MFKLFASSTIYMRIYVLYLDSALCNYLIKRLRWTVNSNNYSYDSFERMNLVWVLSRKLKKFVTYLSTTLLNNKVTFARGFQQICRHMNICKVLLLICKTNEMENGINIFQETGDELREKIKFMTLICLFI